jgi:hypothetical protein
MAEKIEPVIEELKGKMFTIEEFFKVIDKHNAIFFVVEDEYTYFPSLSGYCEVRANIGTTQMYEVRLYCDGVEVSMYSWSVILNPPILKFLKMDVARKPVLEALATTLEEALKLNREQRPKYLNILTNKVKDKLRVYRIIHGTYAKMDGAGKVWLTGLPDD